MPLAEYIAAAQETLKEIPDFFSAALIRVIDARKKFSAVLRLRSSDPTMETASDRTHAYFVGVLESVRQTLAPLMSAFDMQDLKTAANDIHTEQSTSNANLFATLEVYEPSEDFLNAPDITPSRTEPTFTMEAPDPVDEALFALTSLLHDINLLRAEIQRLWTTVKDDVSQLRAVATATNAAVELVRGMEEVMTPLFDSNGGVEKLYETIFRIACSAKGLDPTPQPGGTEKYNLACYEVAGDYLYNAYTVLGDFRGLVDEYHPNQGSLYMGGHGWYDEDVIPVTEAERFKQDKAALFEMLFNGMFLNSLRYARAGQLLAVDDELRRGIRLLQKERRSPMWLCFAAQVHLDILNVLKSDGLGECQDYFLSSLKLIDDLTPPFYEFVDPNPVLEEAIQRVHFITEGWRQEDDIVNIVVKAQIRGLTLDPTKQNRFRIYNPLYCGLHLNVATVQFHETANKYACDTTAMLSTVQLLHCMEQEGVLDRDRKHTILEEIQLYQPVSAFFVGDPPRDAEGYYKNFCISRGVSVTHFARGARAGIPKIHRAGLRWVKNQAVASRYFSAVLGAEDRKFDPASFQKMIEVLESTQLRKNVRQKEEEDSDDGNSDAEGDKEATHGATTEKKKNKKKVSVSF